MKYADFCNTVINALSENNLDDNDLDAGSRCLNDIRIKVELKYLGEEDDIDHDVLCSDFHYTYPEFKNTYHPPYLNDKEICLCSVTLYFLETKIKEFRFYGLAMGSGSGHALMLPTTPMSVSPLEKEICIYYTGRVNVDRLANNLVCVAL